MARTSGEFALIERYFAPLAAGAPGAFALTDDAALVAATPGKTLVATCDALVEGVHFAASDLPEDVAAKALRVNLSDLAAMGATPVAYLLALVAPAVRDEDWFARFAAGLAREQKAFGLHLVGGDMSATAGPLMLAITALGETEPGRVLRRAGAAAGERLFVSGTIGDAALGLRVVQGALNGLEAAAADRLVARLRRPEPRLALGRRLAGVASAAIDVSDGLIADIGHLCEVGGVGAIVHAAALPLSDPARRALALDAGLLSVLVTGGDDYELAFTAAEARRGEIEAIARALGLPLTDIGRIVAGRGVTLVDSDDAEIALARSGYRHF